MDYFAGLDISMDETHVCVLDREGVVVRQSKTESTAQAIAGELAKAPSCRRIVFETGRMAPILFHGLSQLGLPVVCVESRQAYQALKSLATHKTDRNDARGLAHLARTGFFKPVHVKSLQAHALRSLIIARKKLVGQRVTLENQIRGLAVVFGIRLPRALAAAFIDQALKASEGIAGLSAAMRGLITARTAVMTAISLGARRSQQQPKPSILKDQSGNEGNIPGASAKNNKPPSAAPIGQRMRGLRTSSIRQSSMFR